MIPHTKREFLKSAAFHEELQRSKIFDAWWYYTVELFPGEYARGIYPDDMPLLPRIALKDFDVTGKRCLDIGTMEGLIPADFSRRGAAEVIATDCSAHCLQKINLIKHIYDLNYTFVQTPEISRLPQFLADRDLSNFDIINLSGLLYHVFSPITVLSAVRPLLRTGGLMMVATTIILDDQPSMHFNNAGRFQSEANTFWYISPSFFDYMLRYLRLAPIDCIWKENVGQTYNGVEHKTVNHRTGYMAVVCRALPDVCPAADDQWMKASVAGSWEYQWAMDWGILDSSQTSEVAYNAPLKRELFHKDTGTLDLQKAVHALPSYDKPADLSETAVLSLNGL